MVYMMNIKKQTTLERIRKAAQTLIFLYGIKGWSMDDFAKEAGITKRTLYQHIDSKEELVENVLLEYVQNTQADLMRRLRDIPDVLMGLDTILDVYPGLIQRMNSRVIQDILNQYPAIEEHLIEKRLGFTADIREYIWQGQARGLIKREVSADTVIEIIQSLIIYYSKSNPEQFGEKVKESFRAVVYGIVPEGARQHENHETMEV